MTVQDLERLFDYYYCANRKPLQVEKRVLIPGPVMQHAAVHGVHHRGQVALLLRSLGWAPRNFDMLFYDIEKRSAAGPERGIVDARH